jgi:hypothetical protein
MPVLSGELFSSSSTRLFTEIASADRRGGCPKGGAVDLAGVIADFHRALGVRAAELGVG